MLRIARPLNVRIEGNGGVGKWLTPAVLKTVRPQKGLVGSNPTPSATQSTLNYSVERSGRKLPFRAHFRDYCTRSSILWSLSGREDPKRDRNSLAAKC
jgi:hypothetical protein